jgi:hypothetical protein
MAFQHHLDFMIARYLGSRSFGWLDEAVWTVEVQGRYAKAERGKEKVKYAIMPKMRPSLWRQRGTRTPIGSSARSDGGPESQSAGEPVLTFSG